MLVRGTWFFRITVLKNFGNKDIRLSVTAPNCETDISNVSATGFLRKTLIGASDEIKTGGGGYR